MLWLTHALWSSLLAFHLKVLIISVGFESGSVVKNLPANMGDTWAMGSILVFSASFQVAVEVTFLKSETDHITR